MGGIEVVKISGQITSPRGDPLPGVAVVIEATGSRAARQTASTGIKGQFEASVPHSKSVPLGITVFASMPGYSAARETVGSEADHELPAFGLVLRKVPDDPAMPDLDALTTVLLPKLRTPTTGQPLEGVSLQHFQLGLRLLDKDNPEEAAPLLAEVAGRNPGCVECGTLAGLVELETGAWSSADSNLMRASHLTVAARAAAPAHGSSSLPEPLIALGDLEIWRGELPKAAITFLEALALQPDQPLALQELGRTFMLQRKMAAADRYLERALAHGGNPEGHLLRAQALIELNQPGKAQQQIDAYLGGHKPKDLPMGPREFMTLLSKRIELESRPGGATVVDRSPAELVSATPELKGLSAVADPAATESVLREVGLGVEAIFEGFPNTSVQEEVEMQRLHADGKVADSLKQHFQYLLVSSSSSDTLLLNEFRADTGGTPTMPGLPDRDFMVTSGFASIPLVFHPEYQPGSDFRLLGHQQVKGHDALVIAFAERPATAKMLEEFALKSQRVVVLTQGLAWVDPDTFQILRMRTELLKPAPEVRLSAQTTDVSYGPVTFKSRNQTLWLPRDVSVTVHWNGRVYRNLHHYSDYQLFQVGTREKTKAPKMPSVPAGQ
jgi:hypothetical protein